jgi:hypothetical protein
MPRGPKGEKRPADVIGAAVMVGRIATGEIDESTQPDDGKDPAAVALGRKGDNARVEGLSAKRRKEIARLRPPWPLVSLTGFGSWKILSRGTNARQKEALALGLR